MDLVEKLPVPLLSFLYPMKEPDHTGVKTLQVLCLGLGRTGTESLQSALYHLGYSEVHHGWRIASETNQSPQWYRLALAKYRDHDPAFLNRKEFDKVLGDCEAVTDLPSAGFALELLRAYPEAKVILNRREDPEKWHQSMLATLNTIYTDWGSWTRQWVDSETFWLTRIARWNMFAVYQWDIPRKGVEVYLQHYADLEAECKKQNRKWLDWTVQDGWDPLCQFLDKPVPGAPFPNENASIGFGAKRAQMHKERLRRGKRRVAIFGGLIFAVGSAGAAWWWRDSDLVRSSLRRAGGVFTHAIGFRST